jgi:hypothetical protein
MTSRVKVASVTSMMCRELSVVFISTFQTSTLLVFFRYPARLRLKTKAAGDRC